MCKAARPLIAWIGGNDRLNSAFAYKSSVFTRVVYHVSMGSTKFPGGFPSSRSGPTKKSSKLNQLSNGGDCTNITNILVSNDCLCYALSLLLGCPKPFQYIQRKVATIELKGQESCAKIFRGSTNIMKETY